VLPIQLAFAVFIDDMRMTVACTHVVCFSKVSHCARLEMCVRMH